MPPLQHSGSLETVPACVNHCGPWCLVVKRAEQTLVKNMLKSPVTCPEDTWSANRMCSSLFYLTELRLKGCGALTQNTIWRINNLQTPGAKYSQDM